MRKLLRTCISAVFLWGCLSGGAQGDLGVRRHERGADVSVHPKIVRALSARGSGTTARSPPAASATPKPSAA